MKEHNLLQWHRFVVLLVLGAGFEIGLAAGAEKASAKHEPTPHPTLSPSDGERGKATPDEGFVLVRGGAFQMGDVWGDSPWAMRELPIHEVQVDDFLLARHEVTVAEFERFVTATGYKTTAERAFARSPIGTTKPLKRFSVIPVPTHPTEVGC